MPLGFGNDSCLLIVNHELRQAAKNPILGDGGGMYLMTDDTSAPHSILTIKRRHVTVFAHEFANTVNVS